MRSKTSQIRAIDTYIGRQLRTVRRARGMTQKELGAKLGVSHQQLYKYENGSNSLSSGMLYDVAKCLDVLPSIFFDGIAQSLDGGQDVFGFKIAEAQDVSSQEHVELLRNVTALKPHQRMAILNLLRSLLLEEAIAS